MNITKMWYRTTLRSCGLAIAAALSLGICVQAKAWPQTQRKVPVESLIYDLKNPDPVRRREAAKLLGDNKIRRATPDLVEVAEDSDPRVRREIIIALDKMEDIRAQPAFVSLSDDEQKEVRERCILGILKLYLPRESGVSVALNKLANFFNPWSDEWSDVVIEPGITVDSSAIEALERRLQDSEEDIRVKSSRSLGILRARPSLPALVESLQKDESNSVRYESIRSIRKIGDPTAAGSLMNFIQYNDNRIRNEAVYTVGRFRYRDAVDELTRHYQKESELPEKLIDEDYREYLLDALAFIADPKSRTLFEKEMMNPEDRLRLHAIEGLARIGDPSVVSQISRNWLREEDPAVKTAHAFALYKMGREEYLDELVRALGSGNTNNMAKQYLVEFTSAELSALHAQTKNRDVKIREGLAEIIGLIGNESSLPILENLSNDSRGDITSIALQAMRRINARHSIR